MEGDVLGVPLGRVGVAHRDGVHGRAVPAEHRHRVRPRSPRLVAREQGVRVRLRVAGDEPAVVVGTGRALHSGDGVLLLRRVQPRHDGGDGPHVAGPEALEMLIESSNTAFGLGKVNRIEQQGKGKKKTLCDGTLVQQSYMYILQHTVHVYIYEKRK